MNENLKIKRLEKRIEKLEAENKKYKEDLRQWEKIRNMM